MSNLMNFFTIAAVSSIAFASPAFAGDKYKGDVKPASADSMTMTTEMTEIDALTEVRGAVERSDFVAVEGPDGRIYYNRVVPVSELPDPVLDLRVLDTVQVEHDGTIYTNKIVQPVN